MFDNTALMQELLTRTAPGAIQGPPTPIQQVMPPQQAAGMWTRSAPPTASQPPLPDPPMQEALMNRQP